VSVLLSAVRYSSTLLWDTGILTCVKAEGMHSDTSHDRLS